MAVPYLVRLVMLARLEQWISLEWFLLGEIGNKIFVQFCCLDKNVSEAETNDFIADALVFIIRNHGGKEASSETFGHGPELPHHGNRKVASKFTI